MSPTRTSAVGFPTAWYGFPIAGTQSFASLSGSVSVTNSTNLYAEVLFILQYLLRQQLGTTLHLQRAIGFFIAGASLSGFVAILQVTLHVFLPKAGSIAAGSVSDARSCMYRDFVRKPHSGAVRILSAVSCGPVWTIPSPVPISCSR